MHALNHSHHQTLAIPMPSFFQSSKTRALSPLSLSSCRLMTPVLSAMLGPTTSTWTAWGSGWDAPVCKSPSRLATSKRRVTCTTSSLWSAPSWYVCVFVCMRYFTCTTSSLWSGTYVCVFVWRCVSVVYPIMVHMCVCVCMEVYYLYNQLSAIRGLSHNGMFVCMSPVQPVLCGLPHNGMYVCLYAWLHVTSVVCPIMVRMCVCMHGGMSPLWSAR